MMYKGWQHPCCFCNHYWSAGLLLAVTLLLSTVAGSEAADIYLCSGAAHTESNGQITTEGYPRWFSAQQCQCDVTSGNVTTNLHLEVEFKTKDEPTGCDPKIVVSSNEVAPFQICPLTPDANSNVTKATLSLRVGHVTQIVLDNPKDEYLVVNIKYASLPEQALTVTCSGEPGRGVLTKGKSTAADNWWDTPIASSGNGVDSSVIAVIIIAIVIVIMLLTALLKSQMKKREFRKKQQSRRETETRNKGQRDNPGYDPSLHTINSHDITLEDDVTVNTTPGGYHPNNRDQSQPPIVFMNKAYNASTPLGRPPSGEDLNLSLQSEQSSLGGTPDIRGSIPMGISALPDPYRSRQSIDFTPTSSRSASRQPSTSDLRINPQQQSKPYTPRYSPGGSSNPYLDRARTPSGEQSRAGPSGLQSRTPTSSGRDRTPQNTLPDTRVPLTGLHVQPTASPRVDLYPPGAGENFRTPTQSPGSNSRGMPYYLNSSMSPALANNGMSLPSSILPGETEL